MAISALVFSFIISLFLFWAPRDWYCPFASVSFSIFCLQLCDDIEMDESIKILHN